MIPTAFLSDIAAYTKGRITKVVLNGSYVISTFEHVDLADNLLSIQYLIPKGAVETVSLIELQDKDGHVVSSNEVHVPIKADTMLLQTIQVKEALNK
ncbi:ketopantoate hydroxymethyltransferase [Paenibacillus aquistagni]|uniref:Ketopantoate hydroxymethyltransferase n=1 Tax=Paenibacillus aquistagni TaxID=1852522 RepID=A0A1X7KBE2_9BACL|nr:ketopantoate hydroxymethyltransferase [Paenibacillus aquistagni]SMG38204.1 hypothetical protein SAMN06295960_2283 [Paenibacillus aquistagni]